MKKSMVSQKANGHSKLNNLMMTGKRADQAYIPTMNGSGPVKVHGAQRPSPKGVVVKGAGGTC